jgi:hypothetical protein
VKRDTLQPAHPERREAVTVLQVAERSLHSGATPVEVTEPLSVARNAGEEPSAEGEWQGYLLPANATEWDDWFAARSSHSA